MVEDALKVVLGMTVAYLASFAGMIFAWYHYRKRRARPPAGPPGGGQGDGPMIPLQGDPPGSLEPAGGAWIGVVVPLAVLLLSIAVSVWLFRHFARQRSG